MSVARWPGYACPLKLGLLDGRDTRVHINRQCKYIIGHITHTNKLGKSKERIYFQLRFGIDE